MSAVAVQLFITDRIRSTRQEVIVSLGLSVHTCRGGGTPPWVPLLSDLAGGTPEVLLTTCSGNICETVMLHLKPLCAHKDVRLDPRHLKCNKKVLLCECKRHTAHRVSSTPSV